MSFKYFKQQKEPLINPKIMIYVDISTQPVKFEPHYQTIFIPQDRSLYDINATFSNLGNSTTTIALFVVPEDFRQNNYLNSKVTKSSFDSETQTRKVHKIKVNYQIPGEYWLMTLKIDPQKAEVLKFKDKLPSHIQTAVCSALKCKKEELEEKLKECGENWVKTCNNTNVFKKC